MAKKQEMSKTRNSKITRSAMRRQREREQRYQTILSAAEQLFAKAGYHQTGMEQIAEQAEVSVGTVYFYFKNKEDLLIHLLEKIGFDLRQMLGNVFLSATMSLEGFKQAGYVFFEEFCKKNPGKISIIFRDAVGQSALVEKRRKEVFDNLIIDVQQALIRISQSMGFEYQSELSAEVMAVSIMGMYERVAYHYLIWQDRAKDLETISKDAVAFIVGGIHNLAKQT